MTIDDLLYWETDSSCAVCGIRDSRVLTVHHLDGTKPKDERYDNKLILCHNCHACHHLGKGASDEEFREIKRRLIVKTLTMPGLNALKEAYRRGLVAATPFLVNHLIEFGYLVLKQETSHWVDTGLPEGTVMDAIYTISDEGRRLLEKWKIG